MKKVIYTIVILFAFISANSQNKVWLTDGTVLTTNNCKVDDKGNIKCYNEKGKLRYTDTADVFAIIVRETDTTFFYDNPNYPLNRATDFMKGQIDGKNYNNYYVYSGGFLVGIGAPFLMTSLSVFDFLSPVVSIGYIAGFSKVNPNFKFCDIPEEFKDNQDYIDGYKLSATKKKIRNTAAFSTAGLVVGYTVLYFINR